MKKTIAVLFLLASPALATDITITIPDAVTPRVINAMCAVYGYQETINGEPNTETKAQFARRMLMVYLKDITLNYEMASERRAADTALKDTQETKSGELSF
jgi:hypothetical protein